MSKVSTPQRDEAAIVELLGHRYGDGLVYLNAPEEREVFDCAVRRGLINEEGYLTPSGRSLLAQASS